MTETAIAPAETLLATLDMGKLRSALRSIMSAIPKKTRHPWQRGVWIEVRSEGKVELSIYNGEWGMQSAIASPVIHPGAVLIPAQLLSDWLNAAVEFEAINVAQLLSEDQENAALVLTNPKTGNSRYQIDGLTSPDGYREFLPALETAAIAIEFNTAELKAAVTKLRKHTFKGSEGKGYRMGQGIWIEASGCQARLYGTNLIEIASINLSARISGEGQIHQQLPLELFKRLPQGGRTTTLHLWSKEQCEPCALQWGNGVTIYARTLELGEKDFEWPDLFATEFAATADVNWLKSAIANAILYWDAAEQDQKEICTVRLRSNVLNQRLEIISRQLSSGQLHAIASEEYTDISGDIDIYLDAHRLSKMLSAWRDDDILLGTVLIQETAHTLILGYDDSRTALIGVDIKNEPIAFPPEKQADFSITWRGEVCTIQGKTTRWSIDCSMPPNIAPALKARTQNGQITLSQSEARSLYRRRAI